VAVIAWLGGRWIKTSLTLGNTPIGQTIDWSSPWLKPYRHWGEGMTQTQQSGCSVAERLNALTASATSSKPPVRFVPPTALPEGDAYEAFIHCTQSVPTRDNLHDLFNGLVWWRFPQVKKHLNELQATEIKAQGIQPMRGALRDALTLFDENAALLQAPAALTEALQRRDWRALFITHRLLWAEAKLTLFGHALMEKLVVPRKGITAHVWLLPQGDNLDGLLLQSLKPELLAAKPFHPLPVLGVPGWWPDNKNLDFYEDASVFRAAKTCLL
jgi:Protein of unknown function (DUF3025)